MNNMTLPAAMFFLTLSLSLTACGGGGGGGSPAPAKPTSAALLLSTQGPANIDALGAADITFPVPSQYSVTGVTTVSGGVAPFDIFPNSVRVQAAIPTGVRIGATYATVQLAIKDGSTPVASQFQPASFVKFENLSAMDMGTKYPAAITPAFTITNVR